MYRSWARTRRSPPHPPVSEFTAEHEEEIRTYQEEAERSLVSQAANFAQKTGNTDLLAQAKKLRPDLFPRELTQKDRQALRQLQDDVSALLPRLRDALSALAGVLTDMEAAATAENTMLIGTANTARHIGAHVGRVKNALVPWLMDRAAGKPANHDFLSELRPRGW